jgi:antibiotic biosynthesis monooxygenase (ABM) superfamily enzyme
LPPRIIISVIGNFLLAGYFMMPTSRLNDPTISAQEAATQGTSIIVHNVAPTFRANYDTWLKAALEASQSFPGYISTDVVKPVGLGQRYVIILRFTTAAAAEAWLKSSVRAELLAEVEPWLLHKDGYEVHDDSEFWFTTLDKSKPAKRWKQWLLTSSAVFPLTAVIPPFIGTVISSVAPTAPNVFSQAITAGAISAIMVYFAMPVLSRWASAWLSR